MDNIFQHGMAPRPPRNTFDLSHDHKFTCDMGQLIPIFWEETLPGDYWRIKADLLLRALPLISPVYHYIKADIHFYQVPHRITYPQFDDLISPPDPDDPVIVQPQCNSLNAVNVGSIGDYLGIPVGIPIANENDTVLAYPVLAYAKIYDYWYRDQNLQDEAMPTVIAGVVQAYNVLLQSQPFYRSWEHDYFTSALPFAQKGEVVTLPLIDGNAIDVTLKSGDLTGNSPLFYEDINDGTVSTGAVNAGGTGTNTLIVGVGNEPSVIDPNGSLEVILNDVAQDIITVRTAFKVQEFLELDARAGTRLKENTYAHFGVKVPDGRIQEPQYLGGMSSNVVISEVLSQTQTLNSSNSIVNPVGEMAGHGISVGSSRVIKCRVTEHGIIMGILSIRPKTAYSQGLPRKWTRFERLDYPWPKLAHIGEQPILVRELYAETTTPAELDEVFGYIPRYSEMKYVPSRISGLMHTTFDYWHLARQFATKPLLNSDFIECTPRKDIFAVTDEPGFVGHCIFNIKCSRSLPMFSTPKM